MTWVELTGMPRKLAAVWRGGELEVHDAEAMERFVEKYEADREVLAGQGKMIPPFASFLDPL